MEQVGSIAERIACGRCGHSLRRHFTIADGRWQCVFCPADRPCARDAKYDEPDLSVADADTLIVI